MRLKHAVLMVLIRLLGWKVYKTYDGFHFIWLGSHPQVRRAWYIEDFH